MTSRPDLGDFDAETVKKKEDNAPDRGQESAGRFCKAEAMSNAESECARASNIEKGNESVKVAFTIDNICNEVNFKPESTILPPTSSATTSAAVSLPPPSLPSTSSSSLKLIPTNRLKRHRLQLFREKVRQKRLSRFLKRRIRLMQCQDMMLQTKLDYLESKKKTLQLKFKFKKQQQIMALLCAKLTR